MKGLLLMKGIINWAAYGCHFVYPKKAKMNTIEARSKLYSNSSLTTPSAPIVFASALMEMVRRVL